MKKQLMFAGLALASGLSMAQVTTPNATPKLPTTTTNPTSPATPPDMESTGTGSLNGSASAKGVTANGAVGVGTTFGSLDANADGTLSRSEINGNASLRKDFKSFDKDKDGTLSSSEYEVAMKATKK